jgi:hypothetical protein
VVTSGPACDHWRGLLAEDAVGVLGGRDRVGLQEHLAGCAGCRAEAIELAQVRAALDHIGPSAAEGLRLSPDDEPEDARTRSLDAAVARILAESPATPTDAPELQVPTGRRSPLLLPVLAVAAAVLVAVGALLAAGPGGPRTRTLTLTGTGGTRATAVLTAESWGTSVRLSDPAGPARQVMTVSMATEYGKPWVTGSYNSGTGHGSTVTLACALPFDRISSITVSDATGRTILHGT